MCDPSTTQKWSLPSWMSLGEDENKSHGKKPTSVGEHEENKKTENCKQAKVSDRVDSGIIYKGVPASKAPNASSSSGLNFSKLLDGVVFVLSGFVNPERSTLRSQTIAMGADYRADWNSDCTLLVCAFPNTPKFRQVEADCGTIVSKEWITECYDQKKLVEIERYLMHPGKPWRKSSGSLKTIQEGSPPRKSQKVDGGSRSKPTSSTPLKQGKTSYPTKSIFSPSELRKWAADDLNKTITWLDSQEEKELLHNRYLFLENIVGTLIVDLWELFAICTFISSDGIQQITEQWQCLPRVVEELAKLDDIGTASTSTHSKEVLCKHAQEWKRIYEEELRKLECDSLIKKKKAKIGERGNKGRNKAANDAAGSDSDETIEMTEEEIELAYQSMNS